MKALFACIFLQLISVPVWAAFDLPGKGIVTYPTGSQKEFEFGFAWDPEAGTFRIGKKAYDMDLPESYSVAITLSKDDSKVWVQEFTPGFIEGFKWDIGNHTLSLRKQVFSKPVKGDYVLNLDGIDYFLMLNNISVTLNFSENGIENISIDGVTKDMGTKQ
jgi:hypothetical protein